MKKRILAVDDNSDNLYFLRALLEASGFEVLQAGDGHQALRLANHSTPDLVISDLLMPGMDGYTLLRNWRDQDHLKQVPFLVYTATYTHSDDEELARNLGADDFLLKPSEPDALLDCIHRLLARQAPEPNLPAAELNQQLEQLQRYNQTLIRKLNEKSLQLQESNRALRQDVEARQRLAETQIGILDSLPAQVALIDPEGWILAVNRSWKATLKQDPLERRHMAVTQNYFKFLEGLSSLQPLDAVHQGLASVLRGELPLFVGEFALAEVYLRVLVTPFRPDERMGAVVMHLDVTQQRRAEEGLRQSEERFRQLADNLQEVCWSRDTRERRWLYVSPAYEQVWGRSLHSLHHFPDSWLEAVHPQDLARVLESHDASLEQSSELTYRILRPEGEVRWIQERAFPVKDEQGSVYRVVGTSRDITEQKRVERRLLQAQRLQSTTALAAGIASDLHQVMTPIVESLEWLREQETGGERRHKLGALEACARRGSELVFRLMQFAQGVATPHSVVTTSQLLDELEAFLSESIVQPIHFEVQRPEGEWSLSGDLGQLLSALQNLCLNAREAMADGGALRISVHRHPLAEPVLPTPTANSRSWGGAGLRPGFFVCIEIWDNGRGIPPEQLSEVMVPFFTTRPGGEGLGLGLPGALAIIQAHGGFLQLHSVPGQGSRAQVYLPSSPDSEEFEESAASLRGKGELLLFVDQDPASLQLYPALLEASGYRVLAASDGAQAADLFYRHKADVALVILQLQLPVLDGPALIQVLRHLEPGVRIIASTGLEIPGSLAVQLPEIPSLLPRPYDAQQLLQRLRQALEESSIQPA